MQAAVVPAVNGSWQVKDVPQPQAGPNQVLVKMHASGICYTDVHETHGHIPGQFPRILGHEPVGEIRWDSRWLDPAEVQERRCDSVPILRLSRRRQSVEDNSRVATREHKQLDNGHCRRFHVPVLVVGTGESPEKA